MYLLVLCRHENDCQSTSSSARMINTTMINMPSQNKCKSKISIFENNVWSIQTMSVSYLRNFKQTLAHHDLVWQDNHLKVASSSATRTAFRFRLPERLKSMTDIQDRVTFFFFFDDAKKSRLGGWSFYLAWATWA